MRWAPLCDITMSLMAPTSVKGRQPRCQQDTAHQQITALKFPWLPPTFLIRGTGRSKAAASKSLSDWPGTIQPRSAMWPLFAELQSECAWHGCTGAWRGQAVCDFRLSVSFRLSVPCTALGPGWSREHHITSRKKTVHGEAAAQRTWPRASCLVETFSA